MNRKRNITFNEFLECFPEVELPITLTENSAQRISKINHPFPNEAIHEFILPFEGGELDEYTEFLPCFRLKGDDQFFTIVYWKAGLMNYEYKLLTLKPDGRLIMGKVIAGTLSNGETIIRMVASIDEDFIIHVVTNQSNVDDKEINTNSEAYSLEIMGNGEIIFSLNKEIHD